MKNYRIETKDDMIMIVYLPRYTAGKQTFIIEHPTEDDKAKIKELENTYNDFSIIVEQFNKYKQKKDE